MNHWSETTQWVSAASCLFLLPIDDLIKFELRTQMFFFLLLLFRLMYALRLQWSTLAINKWKICVTSAEEMDRRSSFSHVLFLSSSTLGSMSSFCGKWGNDVGREDVGGGGIFVCLCRFSVYFLHKWVRVCFLCEASARCPIRHEKKL